MYHNIASLPPVPRPVARCIYGRHVTTVSPRILRFTRASVPFFTRPRELPSYTLRIVDRGCRAAALFRTDHDRFSAATASHEQLDALRLAGGYQSIKEKKKKKSNATCKLRNDLARCYNVTRERSTYVDAYAAINSALLRLVVETFASFSNLFLASFFAFPYSLGQLLRARARARACARTRRAAYVRISRFPAQSRRLRRR